MPRSSAGTSTTSPTTPAVSSATRPIESNSSSTSTVLAASIVGTTVEWYDFFRYATAAAIVFNHEFFPSRSPGVISLAAIVLLNPIELGQPPVTPDTVPTG